MHPVVIPKDILYHNQSLEVLRGTLDRIKDGIQRMNAPQPDVSIIIPAYNEEANLLKALSSLSASTTVRKVQIIVVDNNSVDETASLAQAAGATCIPESSQGITAARNAGLQSATGTFILNADADTIYPPRWIDLMLSPLLDNTVAMAYGNFSFIPGTGTSRFVYAGYEYVSDMSKWMNKRFRDEALNVYGFNSAFRRSEGIAVDGFNHPPGANEDGWLAVKLRNRFQKKLFRVTGQDALVWTSDRRIQLDGGLRRAISKRVKRQLTGMFM